jgi:hypothetical protein
MNIKNKEEHNITKNMSKKYMYTHWRTDNITVGGNQRNSVKPPPVPLNSS